MAHLFGHGSQKELNEDFGLFGAPPPELLESMQEQDFELWPENVEFVSLFMKLRTQWRVGPTGITGLDYTGVLSVLTFLGIKPEPELFGHLQTMESAALEALRKETNGS